MHPVNTAPEIGAQDHNAPLVGLRVKLRPCPACGCIIAHINSKAMTCDSCGRKRGRLDADTQRFLRDFIGIFGRPTAPIEIRATSSLPSGAGVETSPLTAPLED
jgi:hypothetical protein